MTKFLNIKSLRDFQTLYVFQRAFYANYFTVIFFWGLFLTPSVAATSMSLAVDMGSAIGKTDGNNWQYWAANATEANIAAAGSNAYLNYSQAIVSDIEFDKDENMIIGVMDRFGHQTGTANYIANVVNTNVINGNGQNDNDAVTAGNYKVISFTTGAAGSTNHTCDFGFYPFCDTTLVVANTTICNGSTVNLFAQASGVKGTLSYSTNGTTWTALTNPTNVVPAVTTTYFVKDTLVSGCFDIDTLVITVIQPVTAGVGTNPTTATCQAGSGLSNINLAGQITGATSGGTWSQTSGTVVGTALNTATGGLNPNGIAVGSYVFRYTVKGTAPCPDAATDITITIENCCPPSVCLPVSVVRN